LWNLRGTRAVSRSLEIWRTAHNFAVSTVLLQHKKDENTRRREKNFGGLLFTQAGGGEGD
jgi:hypothetical protein